MNERECSQCDGKRSVRWRTTYGDTYRPCPACCENLSTAAEIQSRMEQAAIRMDKRSTLDSLWSAWNTIEMEKFERIAADERRAAEARIMGTDNRAPSPTAQYTYRNDATLPDSRWLNIDPASEWDSSTHSYDPTSELPQQEPSTMNSSTAIFLVTDKVRAIRVAYDTNEANNNPGYLFKTFDQSIAKDDLVVVPTTTRHGFTICKVVEVDVDVDYTGGGVQYKWIAGKFDRAQYDQTLEQEQDIIDKVNRAERARKRQELAAALKLDEVQLGDNPLLLGGTSATPEQAS